MHNSSRNKGGAGNSSEKPIAFNYVDNIPEVTNREMYKSSRNKGGAGAHEQGAQRNRKDAYNMNVNISKEQIAQGRAPTQSNYTKIPTFEMTRMELRDPTQSIRAPVPGYMPCNGKLIPQQSYNGNSKFYINDRILSHIDENLKHNTLVNNLVHKSSYQ